MTLARKNIGSDFDDFLEEDGILREVEAAAVKRVLAFQINEEMAKLGLSKTAMARRMGTSRAALDRLVSPENDAVTLKTICRAAAALGKRLKVEFV